MGKKTLTIKKVKAKILILAKSKKAHLQKIATLFLIRRHSFKISGLFFVIEVTFNKITI